MDDMLPESGSDADMSDDSRLVRFPPTPRVRRPVAHQWRVERSPRFAEPPHHLSNLPRWRHPRLEDAWVETPTMWIRVHRVPHHGLCSPYLATQDKGPSLNTLKGKRVTIVLKVSEDLATVALKWVITEEFNITGGGNT